jgi:hypothetical protein
VDSEASDPRDRRPLVPTYGWVGAGEPIELYDGPGVVDGQDLRVQLRVPMLHDVHPTLHAAGSQWIRVGETNVRIEHPDFGDTSVSVAVNSSWGTGDVMPSRLGPGGELDRVIVHWLNVPHLVPAAPLETPTSVWLGRLRFNAGPWLLTLDSRPDLSEVLRSARDVDAQFVMTHVGEVRRVDGAVFAATDAEEVIFGWQLAMSFALGRWVSAALPVGFDGSGARRWEYWAAWRCDWLRGYQSWLPTRGGTDLVAFTELFAEAWNDAEERAVVRLLAMHAVAANHSGTTGEARVMLAQAALEYLAWVDLVLSNEMSRRKFGELQAADKLRMLLQRAGISLMVPQCLDKACEIAAVDGLDGPEVITWLRNRLTHPKKPDEPYEITGLVWQVSQLTLEYLELLLLRRLQYNGQFSRRYPPGIMATESEPVPWAVAGIDSFQPRSTRL